MTRDTECLVTGHRGFKGGYTENTITGFEKCFEFGATLFETDVWTTKDGVVVISHDVNTNRIFVDADGNETNYNILETEYDKLKDLQTVTGEKMLTFPQLLQWFYDYVNSKGYGSEHRIMLDIKNANPPLLLNLLIRDIRSVHDDLAWWFPRLQFGLWHLRFVKYMNQDPELDLLFLKTEPNGTFRHFDILHISLSWQDSLTYMAYNEYIRKLDSEHFKVYVTGISIVYMATWNRDYITHFLPVLRLLDMALYSWTINNRAQLEYFRKTSHLAQIEEYGIITDFPDKMTDLLRDSESKEKKTIVAPDYVLTFKMRILYWVYHTFLKLVGRKNMPGTTKYFADYVDPSETNVIRRSLGIRVFAFLQLKNIF